MTKNEKTELGTVREEVADVKQAVHRHFRELRDSLAGRFEALEGSIDSRADTLLGRMAASQYSILYVVGVPVGAFLLGVLVGGAV